MPRTGRRPGATGRTRERILQAARQDFSNAGYDGVTIRGIAAQAKVDPALVLHYYVGLPVDAVARTLGITPGGVKSRLSRGRAATRVAQRI